MMKQLLLLFLLIPLISFGKKDYGWNLPINSETHKATFDGVIAVDSLDKETIFRRVKKFIAIENFDKSENIKCKDGSTITSKFYDKAIRYEDEKDGVIIGSGYMPVLWRRFNYIWVVFEFKILASNNSCRYEFTDFTVLNFFSAPKAKTRSFGSAFNSYGSIFGTSSGSTTLSSNKIQQVPIESYVTGKGEGDSYNEYFRNNPQIFMDQMSKFEQDLKNSIIQKF